MQCPLGDGELVAHTTQGENNLTVSYSTCPTCHGFWMDSFAANYIRLPRESAEPETQTTPAHCPLCQKELERSQGQNIPANVSVFECPGAHGYFFPKGQLAAFKKAQQVKLTYHKLWNIPLPSVKSVLLTAILVLGLVSAYGALQYRQTITSQAKDYVVTRNVYVAKDGSVLIQITTTAAARAEVIIPSFQNFQEPMTTTDNIRHLLLVQDMPAGTHQYSVVLTIGNTTVETPKETFIVP